MSVVGPDEFIYRLNGDEVATLVGKSYNLHPISTISDDVGDKALALHLTDVLRDRQAYRCSGDLRMFDRDHINFESVDCPLTDNNGKITHFIGVLERV